MTQYLACYSMKVLYGHQELSLGKKSDAGN
jgi:hypothetical protein